MGSTRSVIKTTATTINSDTATSMTINTATTTAMTNTTASTWKPWPTYSHVGTNPKEGGSRLDWTVPLCSPWHCLSLLCRAEGEGGGGAGHGVGVCRVL